MSCDILLKEPFGPIKNLIFMQDGTTAVSYAAQYGHSEVVILLINANADINLPDKVILIINIFVLSELQIFILLYDNY